MPDKDKDIIKIKRSAKKSEAIPTLAELTAGLSEWILKNSVEATLHHMRAGISSGQSFVDIPFIINKNSDYDLMDKVISKLREVGYDIELIKKDAKPIRLPEGKEFTQVTITNRYHLVDRKTLNKDEVGQALQAFERIKKVIGENK